MSGMNDWNRAIIEEFRANGADDRDDGELMAQKISRDPDLIELDRFGYAQPIFDQPAGRDPRRDAAPQREQQPGGRDYGQYAEFQTDGLDGAPRLVRDVGGQ